MNIRRVLVGVVVLLSAVILDRLYPISAPTAVGSVPTAPSGGVLACPLATTGSADATLYLANVGEETGRARVFIRTETSKTITQRLGLVPGQIESIDLDELTTEASGLAVEWSGGRIIAAHSLHSKRRSLTPSRQLPRFMSVAQCFESLGPELTVAAARTDLLGNTTLSVFNPGPAPADISIAIRSDGQYSQPERLQGRIIRPLARRDFSLRDFTFGSDDVVAVITAHSGRVVAEALVENRGGSELISAVPPLSEALAMTAVSGGSASLSLASTQRSLRADAASGIPAEIAVPLATYRYGPGLVESPKEIPEELAPGQPGRIIIPSIADGAGVAYAVQPLAGRIAAATSWQVSAGGVFDLVVLPAAQPVTTWHAIVPAFGANWNVSLLASAAAGQEATAQLKVIGPRPFEETVEIVNGQLKRVTVDKGSGVHAVMLTSDVPIAASFVGQSGGIAYGTLSSSLRAANATALSADPVVGIGRGAP